MLTKICVSRKTGRCVKERKTRKNGRRGRSEWAFDEILVVTHAACERTILMTLKNPLQVTTIKPEWKSTKQSETQVTREALRSVDKFLVNVSSW